MFKWPGTPSPKASEHELADYAELVCWKQNSTSTNALSADLGRLEENDYYNGVPEEEETDQYVTYAYEEIERREKACRNGYPFVIGKQGNTLLANQDVENQKHIIYKYLLLATRLNMKENRMHACIDGTLLFEEFSAEVARCYFGARAKSLVFGTASGNANFEEKVNNLCFHLGEGDGFKDNSGLGRRTAKDGKLDVVVWTHFTDGLPGKLIAFGQCKTGTNYKDNLTQLQPDSFCKKWLQSPLILTPVRMFFVAEALSRSRWNASYDAGLLFDRCRIVDYCDDVSSDVLKKVMVWTEAAAEESELSG